MYTPLTWENNNGEVQTKASKPALAKRLYLMEYFYFLYKTCLWALDQYKEYALLVRSGKLSPDVSDFIERQLPRYRQRYLQARQRLNNLSQRIASGNMALPEENELSMPRDRTITPEQLSRLLTVLRDNGIVPDETRTVPEAACYMLDTKMKMPSDPALLRLAHSFSVRHCGTIFEFYSEPLDDNATGVSILVHVEASLDANMLNFIEEAIFSHIEAMPTWSFEQLIHDVLQSFGYRFTILSPNHTFRI